MHCRQIIRVAARIRGRTPILGFLPCYVLGQSAGLAASLYGQQAAIVAIAVFLSCTLILFCAGRSSARALLASGFLPGVLLSCVAFQHDARPAVSRPALFARVEGPFRYARVGAIQFSAAVMDGEEKITQRLWCEASHVPWRNSAQLTPGSIVVIRGEFKPLVQFRSIFSRDSALWRAGYSGRCNVDALAIDERPVPVPFVLRVRDYISAHVQRVLGEGERSGLMLSLAFGFRDSITSITEESFRRTGLAHLLVFSGYQVSLLYGFVLGAVIWCRRILGMSGPAAWAHAPAALAACSAVVLVEQEPSAVRAGVAVLSMVGAVLLDRRSSLSSSIAVSFLCVCTLWPCSFLDPGVQLTYAALCGFVLAAGVGTPLEWRAAVIVRASCYASVCTALVAIPWFGGFSAGGLILNPILAPIFSTLGTLGGMAGVGLCMLGLDAEGFVLNQLAAMIVWGRDVVCWLAWMPGMWLDDPVMLWVVWGVMAVWIVSQLRSCVRRLCIQEGL